VRRQQHDRTVPLCSPCVQKISAYYSSIDKTISATQIVRDWLNTQSFEEQYKFGIKVLESFGIYVGK